MCGGQSSAVEGFHRSVHDHLPWSARLACTPPPPSLPIRASEATHGPSGSTTGRAAIPLYITTASPCPMPTWGCGTGGDLQHLPGRRDVEHRVRRDECGLARDRPFFATGNAQTVTALELRGRVPERVDPDRRLADAAFRATSVASAAAYDGKQCLGTGLTDELQQQRHVGGDHRDVSADRSHRRHERDADLPDRFDTDCGDRRCEPTWGWHRSTAHLRGGSRSCHDPGLLRCLSPASTVRLTVAPWPAARARRSRVLCGGVYIDEVLLH